MHPSDSPPRPPAHPQPGWRDLIPHGRGPGWSAIPGATRVRTTYSGRGAIYQYLAQLRTGNGPRAGRTRVLVPSFHCPTVVDPILHAGFEVRYYGINCALEVQAEDLLAKLDHSVAAALFIRYFGVTSIDPALFTACRQAGARVIDDSSHAFLAANPLRLADRGADATIYSFWKLVPSLVGGGLLAGEGAAAPTRQGRPTLRESISRARALAGAVADVPGRTLARLLRRTEKSEEVRPAIRKPAAEAYPYDPRGSSWRLPATARLILTNADLEQVVEARRRNYRVLAESVAPTPELRPLWRSLPDDACPWGFPLLLERRGERDYLMRASGVPVFTFGEVLHPSVYDRRRDEPQMVTTADYLAASLLAIGVHQQIEAARIAGIAALVNRFAAGL